MVPAACVNWIQTVGSVRGGKASDHLSLLQLFIFFPYHRHNPRRVSGSHPESRDDLELQVQGTQVQSLPQRGAQPLHPPLVDKQPSSCLPRGKDLVPSYPAFLKLGPRRACLREDYPCTLRSRQLEAAAGTNWFLLRCSALLGLLSSREICSLIYTKE